MGFETDEASSSTHVPGEDVPFLGQNQQLSSPLKTFANIFMSLVGAGVLELPCTFKRTGWVMGSLLIISIATLSNYCMMLLVYCRRKLESQFEGAKISSFGDLGFAVCGPIGRFVVDVMIVLSQACFSVGYMIFIGALGVVMVEDVLIYLKNRPSLEMFGGFSVFFYCLGVAVFAFEGMGMVLSLESETRDKNKFGKILGLSVAFVAFLYGAFGALGYFAFGEETKDIITTNFRQGSLSSLVQLGLCINLFLAFPLMMNPVYEVMERRFNEGRYCLWLRWLVVLTVCCVALTVLILLISCRWLVAVIVLFWAFAVYGTSSSLAKIFSEMA
ncbi:hypothetical protein RDI58_005590 [Solanum bulbocastanum]|uniref:Amino acid transporter transmembrane domain-containing protein n=1 Tax=Solanum bulbocastanum TaxID=147425 RepID=A0AAN8U8M4_SOLBU